MAGIHLILILTVAVIALQVWIFNVFGLKKVTYSRRFGEPAVFEGESVELIEEIRNRKWLPVPWLRIESMIHANLQFAHQDNLDISKGQTYQNHKSLFALMPYTQIVRRHTMKCAKRGHYLLNSVSLSSGDILSLSVKTRQIGLSEGILVYPALLPYDQIPFPSQSWQGDVVVRRWIVDDPFLISGAREYQYGDDLRYINWKSTARSGKLQVHKHDYTADYRLMICVNFAVSSEMWTAVSNRELIERGISMAATIAQYALSAGLETGFACNGHLSGEAKESVRILPMNGSDHLTLLYQTMAKLEIALTQPFDAFLEQETALETRNTDFVLITAYVDEKIQAQMDRLREMGNSVGVLPLAAEASSRGGDADDPGAHEKMAARVG